jgi:hypothetical protein
MRVFKVCRRDSLSTLSLTPERAPSRSKRGRFDRRSSFVSGNATYKLTCVRLHGLESRERKFIAWGNSSRKSTISNGLQKSEREHLEKDFFAPGSRVARWHIFKPKILIWVTFGGSCTERCWYNICPFGLFYSHTVYFAAIWYILWLFWYICSCFGMLYHEKNWQPCLAVHTWFCSNVYNLCC